jgi:hypothetical protein
LFKPFGGFADTQVVEEGRIKPHQSPGVGFELKNDLYTVMKIIAEAALAPGAKPVA